MDEITHMEAEAATAETAPASRRAVESGCERRSMIDPDRRSDVLLRLSKVTGQVQGVSRMVGADRYCIDVLNQIAAAQKALDRVAEIITRNYLERCVTDAITSGDPVIYDELMKVVHRRR